MLEAALHTRSDGSEAPAQLFVQTEGQWFQLSGGERVSCKGRQAQRALLLTLARRRLEAPGTPVSRRALLEAAWPGEKLVGASGRNRLHVALSALRSMGLRSALIATEDGYHLDPDIACRLIG
jgi:hypothetical protein